MSSLKKFHEENPGWLFGHLAFEMKDEIFGLTSSHPNPLDFGAVHFFVPRIIIQLSRTRVHISSTEIDPASVFNQVQQQEINSSIPPSSPEINKRITKEAYLQTIAQLREHMHRGDCYELNYCQEFFCNNVKIDPVGTYEKLMKISPAPFASLYKIDNNYCLCSSPERFLRKKGSEIISQPMKGTARRKMEDPRADEEAKIKLRNNPKELSENVMIVDLVRNDLSQFCQEGTVHVKELFGVYSFPKVHQLVSTVSGEVRNDLHWTDIIRATFPMGSMTGAPKKRVLELIEKYEISGRGLFSGSIGYITPAGDFDFNVVIRSLFYNPVKNYISFQTGGGITFNSVAEEEYEECLLKAESLFQAINS